METLEHVTEDPVEEAKRLPKWHSSLHPFARRNGINSTLPNAFWNDKEPQFFKVAESPLDRRICELHLQGYQATEIAALVGRDRATIINILHQPYARAYLAENAKRPLNEELKSFLDAELMENLRFMKAVRDGAVPESRVADRMAAAKELSDRVLGRTSQPFAMTNKSPLEMTQAELDAAVKSLVHDATATGNNPGIPAPSEDSK